MNNIELDNFIDTDIQASIEQKHEGPKYNYDEEVQNEHDACTDDGCEVCGA